MPFDHTPFCLIPTPIIMDDLSSNAQSTMNQISICYNMDEEYKNYFHRLPLTPAGNWRHLDDERTVDERLQLLTPDTIDKTLIPLYDKRYKGSILLEKVSRLLTEVAHRAQRPAFTTHVDIPSNLLKDERCSICLEDLEANTANMKWRSSHSPVMTSCGHVFGGNCLSIWLSNVQTRSCPYCRKDFNQIDKGCDLMWKTRGDLWRWYVDRKHTMLACEGHCGQNSGRYCWDYCGLDEIQAQFLMQDTFPIPPEHWVYIILDINVFLRAGDHLSRKKLKKYVKRTRIVLDGLCDHIPGMDAQIIKDWHNNALDGYEKIGEWPAEKRNNLCVKLLNMLHSAVELFERCAHLGRRDEFNKQLDELTMIDLDSLQADCGRNDGHHHFDTSQTIWEYACFVYEGMSRLDYAPIVGDLNGLRNEHDGVLDAFRKLSQRTSNPDEARSMRIYLMDRIAVLNASFQMFSDIIRRCNGRALGPNLVEGDSEICRAYWELKALETEEREQARARKLSKERYRKLARRQRTKS
jgi:hypothetical protein